MARYNHSANFGDTSFELGDVGKTTQPSTLKTNIGKRFLEKDVGRATTDIILEIQGIFTGHDRRTGQTFEVRILEAKAALEALQDGFYHSYSDGQNSGNFVIRIGSLRFPEAAINSESGTPIRFSMTLVEWII